MEINSHVWKSAFGDQSGDHSGDHLYKVAMDRERSPRRNPYWSSTAPPAPASWQQPRPRATVLQPQNLTWQPNPRAAHIMNISPTPNIPGLSPQPDARQPRVSGLSPQHDTRQPRVFGPMLPAEFCQNPNFLDSRSIAGLNLARWVKKTDWSVRKQIDGCPTHLVPLHSLLYQGWNSYWIRHVAEGKPTFLAGFRSMAEVVFCHALFGKLRDEEVDLDELARIVHGSDDDKVQATQQLASKVVELMMDMYPKDPVDTEKTAMAQQIQLLQQQLANFSNASPVRTPTQVSEPQSKLPIEVKSPEQSVKSPEQSLESAASTQKAPDGSTRLLRNQPAEPKSSLMQAFQKGKPSESIVEPSNASGPEANVPDRSSGGPALEYGTSSHVGHVVKSVLADGSKRQFLTRSWKTCKSDKEVSAWIDGLTLSKSNRTKLSTWTAHVQRWHSELPANEQADLDQVLANWGVPIRDVAKLKSGSLLRILAVGTILVA